jgi:hypothetical protein
MRADILDNEFHLLSDLPGWSIILTHQIVRTTPVIPDTVRPAIWRDMEIHRTIRLKTSVYISSSMKVLINLQARGLCMCRRTGIE